MKDETEPAKTAEPVPFETFAPLATLPFIRHAFTRRTTIDTKSDEFEERFVAAQGFGAGTYASAEQPHGNQTAIAVPGARRIPQVDALATREPGLPLVVRCADCAAVYIVDRQTPAIALVHSGKKGTLGNIVGNAVQRMQLEFGSRPRNCLAFISPAIGPCHYEMDLWSGIERQLHEAGLREIHNPRVCTACHLDRYFSYRAEKGKTGRMLALLALNSP
ncbi:MAG TPA: polyphenol oxidase family protein [Verrucomicrobiae bacterium]|nr:polyphenol oxidase family protein [Verrucomicrobiae bacterium]